MYNFISIGGDMFIIGFVTAIILIVKPVNLNPFSILRDLFFCIVACAWVHHAFSDHYFNYFQAYSKEDSSQKYFHKK